MYITQSDNLIRSVEHLCSASDAIQLKLDSQRTDTAELASELSKFKKMVNDHNLAIGQCLVNLVTAISNHKPEEFFMPPSFFEALYKNDPEGSFYYLVLKGVEPGIYKFCHEAWDKIFRIKGNGGAPGYKSFIRILEAYTKAYESKTLERIPRPKDQYPERTAASEARIPSPADLEKAWKDYQPTPGEDLYVVTAGPQPGITATAATAASRLGIAYKVDNLKAGLEAYSHALENGYVHVLG